MDVTQQHGTRRWWALGTLGLVVLVLGIDMTILNVALPTLAAEMQAGTGQQQWIVDAFLIAQAATMLPAGLLGDRFGRRLMLVLGLLLLLAGSVLGVLTTSPDVLIAARILMGLGAALISPLSLALLPAIFGPGERTKAVAAITTAFAAGLTLGPLIGGWLLDRYWWGSIMLINVPLVAVGLGACLLLLPEARDPGAPRVDPLSTALSAGGLGGLVYGLIEGPERGWDDPLVMAALVGSVPLLLLLLARERQRPRPLLGIGLLRDPAFGWNALIGALIGFILSGLLFLLPPYLQAVRGHDALDTGLRLLPLLIGIVVAARGCQPLVRQFGTRGVVATGLVLLSYAGIQGSTTEIGSSYGLTAAWLTVTGLGAGLALVPATEAALGALPADRSGIGLGLLMTLRLVGGALGVALLGSMLAQVYRDRLDTGGLSPADAEAARESVVAAHLVADRTGLAGLTGSADAAFVHGMSLTLYVCAIGSLFAALLAGLLLPQPSPRTGAAPLVAAEGDARE